MVSDRYSLGSECRAHDSVPHPKTETETNSNKPIILTGAEQLKGAGDVVAGHNHLGALRQSDRACRQRTQGCNTHQMSSTAHMQRWVAAWARTKHTACSVSSSANGGSDSSGAHR